MELLWLFIVRTSVPTRRLIDCCATEGRSVWKSFSLLRGPQRCSFLHLTLNHISCQRTLLISIRTSWFLWTLELFRENHEVVLCWCAIPALWLVGWWRSTTRLDYISGRDLRLGIQSINSQVREAGNFKQQTKLWSVTDQYLQRYEDKTNFL